MRNASKIRRMALNIGPLAGLLAIASGAGCYERVVRAEGLGAQGVAVQKPYRSETPLDKAFDGNGSGFGSSSSSSTTTPKAPTAPRAPR